MYDADRTRRQAFFCCLGLLPISALLVAVTTDRPLSWYWWMIAIVVADMILCLFIGALCMLLGFAILFVKPHSETGQHLGGFGASLGVIFFSVAEAMRLFSPDDQNSGGA